MITKRRGKFYVTEEVMMSSTFGKVLAKIEFVPITAKFIYEKGLMEYHGFSPLFRELGENEIEPEYSFFACNDGGWVICSVEVIDKL